MGSAFWLRWLTYALWRYFFFNMMLSKTQLPSPLISLNSGQRAFRF
ncbi:hypothetical protein COO91_11128 (plasmid) [Nostoc flagelliforme CCNUN1]|uniref:Uncharacterized protein n=1 Tax=Nostoc flagelliforme CCNUN1 TaxID=2038116 RepID=A0A2K8TCY4_9NOSO|nr:hypothetical protein COO91_11128 [Nostoc flagelliforme CCNUN1]